MPDKNTRAVVLLSGGLDSATTLAIAGAEGHACHALSVAYGQRHAAELEAAARIALSLGAREHRTVDVDLGQFGGSALTDRRIAVPMKGLAPGIPATYVPARNTVILSLALAWAEVLGARDIFAHPLLFRKYGEMLQSLSASLKGKVPESDLRRFQKSLLQELGYELSWITTPADKPFLPRRCTPIAWNTAPCA